MNKLQKLTSLMVFLAACLLSFPINVFAATVTPSGTVEVTILSEPIIQDTPVERITIKFTPGQPFSNGTVKFSLNNLTAAAGTDSYQIGTGLLVALEESQISGNDVTISGRYGSSTVSLILNNKTYSAGQSGTLDGVNVSVDADGAGTSYIDSYGASWSWSVVGITPSGVLTVTHPAIVPGNLGNDVTLDYAIPGSGSGVKFSAGGFMKFTLPDGFTANVSDTITFTNSYPSTPLADQSQPERVLSASEISDSGHTVIISSPVNLYVFGTVTLKLKNKTAPASGVLAFKVEADKDGAGANWIYSLGTGNEAYIMPSAVATLPGSIIFYKNVFNGVRITNFNPGVGTEFAITYTPGENFTNATVVFTVPTEMQDLTYDAYCGPDTVTSGLYRYRNTGSTPVMSKSGNKITLTGVNATTSGVVELHTSWVTAPVEGTYNFIVTADADGTGIQQSPTVPVSPGTAKSASPGTGTEAVAFLSSPAGVFEFASATYSAAKQTGEVTLTINRVNGAGGQVKVYYASEDGTALSWPLDQAHYTRTGVTNPSNPASLIQPQLTFENGETSKTIKIILNADSTATVNKVFYVNLYSPSGGATLGTANKATVTITPEPAGVLQFNSATYSVAKEAGTATLTVSRVTGTSGTVTVDYATSNGSGIAGTDYTSASETLTFEEGETSKSINVDINANSTSTDNKTFTVTLSSPGGGALLGTVTSAEVMIRNPGVLELGSATYSVAKEVGTVALSVSRATGIGGAVTVTYATSDGTGIAGTDYTAASGTLTFAQGETSKTINIAINADATATENKTFTVTLSSPGGGALLGTVTSAIVTIKNSKIIPESAGQILFFSETFSGYGGKTAGITIIRSDGFKGEVGVTWTVTGTAVLDTDYTGDTTTGTDKTTGTVTFANGEKSKTVLFPISQTATDGRTIILTLSSPTGKATLGATNSATLKIQGYVADSKTQKNTVKELKPYNPTIEVRPGTSVEALVLGYLSNGAMINLAGSEITWVSAKPTIATVSNGVITGVALGTTKVKATYEKKTTIFSVTTALKTLEGTDSSGTTIPEPGKGITTPELKLPLNATTTIALAATQADSVDLAVTEEATWNSSNKKVATVTPEGVITTIGSGVSTITGSYGGKKVVAKVNTTLKSLVASYPDPTTPKVIFTPAAGKKPAELKMKLSNESVALVVDTTYADDSTANVAADSNMVWKSNKETIATVDKGVITTTALPGVATITGTYAGSTGKKVVISVNTNLKDLTVTYPSPTTPTVIFTAGATAAKPSDLKMKPGDVSKALVVTNTFANDESSDVAGAADAKWESSSAKIATVEKGVITTSATNLGTATIKVTYGGKKATIKVNTAITGLTADKTELKLKPNGAIETILLTANFANGNSDTGNITATSAVWKSSNTKVATVDTSGLVTSVGPGTADISAKYGGKTVKIKVITSLTLATDSTASVTVGENKTVTVTATYADGTTEDVTAKASWGSSKATVASVSSGQITGIKAGTATINITYLGVKKGIAVTVS